MRFFQTVLAGAALIAAALATVELNEVPSSLKPGQSVTITYTASESGPVEFILRSGDPNNLDNLGPIGTGNGGSFTWVVPDDLPNGNYAFEITQGTENNFSGLIPLSGSTATATPSGSSSASASASSSASASTSKGSTLTTATSASASISSSSSGNSTISSPTLSRTGTATTSPTGSGSPTRTGAPENTGAASILGSSPMALIFGAVAAMAYLN